MGLCLFGSDYGLLGGSQLQAPLLFGLNQALDDDVNQIGLLLVDVQILDHRAFEADATDAATVAGFDNAQAQGAVQKLVEQGGYY